MNKSDKNIFEMLYNYCLNSPLSLIDPTGMYSEPICTKYYDQIVKLVYGDGIYGVEVSPTLDIIKWHTDANGSIDWVEVANDELSDFSIINE